MNNYEKQAKNFLEKTKTNIQSKRAEQQTPPLWHKEGENYGYKYIITITREKTKQSYIFNYWDSIHNKEQKKLSTPTIYDILACLDGYSPGAFQDFCDNFEYNNDSIIAEKTYKAVVDQYFNLTSIFTTKELEQLNEIN